MGHALEFKTPNKTRVAGLEIGMSTAVERKLYHISFGDLDEASFGQQYRYGLRFSDGVTR